MPIIYAFSYYKQHGAKQRAPKFCVFIDHFFSNIS